MTVRTLSSPNAKQARRLTAIALLLALLVALILALALAAPASSSVKDPCPLSAVKPHKPVCHTLPPDPRLFCVGRGTVIVCVYLPRWLVRRRP